MKRVPCVLPILVVVVSTFACSFANRIFPTQVPVAETALPTEGVTPEKEQPTSSPVPTPSVRPTPHGPVDVQEWVEVVDLNWARFRYGDTTFFGIVKNISPENLELLQVAVILKDDTGQSVAVGTSHLLIDVLRPGETAPFHAYFEDPILPWSAYELVFQGGESDTLTSYREFEITSQSLERRSSDEYALVGKLKNSGGEEAEYVRVAVVLYDAAGKVMGVGRGMIVQKLLGPGESATFEVNVYGIAQGSVDHFEVLVEGDFPR